METTHSASVTLPADPCRDEACRGSAAVPSPDPHRAGLVRRAFVLEYVTIAWMVVEAAVATYSGVRAGSVSLTAFGLDSVIELASAGVLIWRLIVELRHGQLFAENAERTAGRVAGGLLFVLAAYVVASAAGSLWARTGQAFSWPGLVVAACAMPIMYLLARRKLSVAEALGSRAMRADAMEAVTCGWLSLVVLVGLLAQALTGAWSMRLPRSASCGFWLKKAGRHGTAMAVIATDGCPLGDQVDRVWHALESTIALSGTSKARESCDNKELEHSQAAQSAFEML